MVRSILALKTINDSPCHADARGSVLAIAQLTRQSEARRSIARPDSETKKPRLTEASLGIEIHNEVISYPKVCAVDWFFFDRS